MKASEYIRASRDELAKGWCQGQTTDGQNVCAYGALGVVTRRIPQAVAESLHLNGVHAVTALESHAIELGFRGVVHMNDDPTTTHRDMLNLFDKTAIALEEVGE